MEILKVTNDSRNVRILVNSRGVTKQLEFKIEKWSTGGDVLSLVKPDDLEFYMDEEFKHLP